MNIWDIVIIAVIIAAILLAVWLLRRKKGTGCSCGCDGCRKPCSQRKGADRSEDHS